jgi:hypothetical protein
MNKVKGVPIDYMDVQTLWNDRRDPHANPMSSSPRRMEARAPTPSGLSSLVDQIYRKAPGDNTYRSDNTRLYGSQSGR